MHLEKNSEELENLQREANELLSNKIIILKKQKFYYTKWTEEEKLYLVLGKMKL